MERATGTHSIRGWVGPRAGLEALRNRKVSWRYWQLNHDCSPVLFLYRPHYPGFLYERGGKEKFPTCPEVQTPAIQPVSSHYSELATPANSKEFKLKVTVSVLRVHFLTIIIPSKHSKIYSSQLQHPAIPVVGEKDGRVGRE